MRRIAEGCVLLAGVCATCSPGSPRPPMHSTPETLPGPLFGQEEPRDTGVPRAQDGGGPAADAGLCWTVARVEDRVDAIADREVVVIGYLHVHPTAVPALADSRGETAARLAVVGNPTNCDGLTKISGRLLHDTNNQFQGPSFILQDDGTSTILLGNASTCAAVDDCMDMADEDDGGRAPCRAATYRGSLGGAIVPLKELSAHPSTYAGRDILVDGIVWSRRTVIPSLRITEQHDGAFVEAEVRLQTTDRELRRQIRACDGTRLRAFGRVQLVAAGSGSTPRLQVTRIALP